MGLDSPLSWRKRRPKTSIWAKVRLKVFDRDGWACVRCSKKGRLECDHVTPLEDDHNQDMYSMGGLQTLCRGCHIEKSREEARARFKTPPAVSKVAGVGGGNGRRLAYILTNSTCQNPVTNPLCYNRA